VNHYERLGVPRAASARQMARAFRRVARRAHPDVGGSPEDFTAAAEAYRVLSDPALRAEYDRVLDGGAASWDDVDWGAEVGREAAADDVTDSPKAKDDGPRPWNDGGSGVDAPKGGGTLDQQGLDPFVGPPLRVPDPLAPGTSPLPSLPPSAAETRASVVTWALFVAAPLLMILAEPVAVSSQTGGTPEDGPHTLLISWGFFVGLAVVIQAEAGPGSAYRPLAWIASLFAAGTPLALLSFSLASTWWFLAGTVVAWATLAASVYWARQYRTRRSCPARVAALRQADTKWLLDRHHRAVEWNAVRASLLQPGTALVVVGPVATDPAGVPVPGHRWAWNPRTRVEAVWAVPDGTPQGWWLVFDDEDRVVASAPAGAPQAWLSALSGTAAAPASA
jgi:hypothetical protein